MTLDPIGTARLLPFLESIKYGKVSDNLKDGRPAWRRE